MMATKQKSRNRRPSTRDRGPRYVEPVLDPNWQSPYVPSAEEREANSAAVRRYGWRRRIPATIAVAVLVVALVVGVVVSIWLAVLGVVIGALYGWDLYRSFDRLERLGTGAGDSVGQLMGEGGTTHDRQRLATVVDRLCATFGVDGVSAVIIDDEGYNATLMRRGGGLVLYVTSALLRDFELIELEGVVAHCLARQRLGLVERQCIAASVSLDDSARRALAGVGQCYRADEVAAAAIRYPLGLANALHRCADQEVREGSYFASPAFAATRWSWFNPFADRSTSDLGDLDDPTLRSLALEEW